MMFPKPPKKKKGILNGLKNKVWKNFSIYIRLRDASDGSGVCFCISCSKPHHWKDMDAGHYIPREWTKIWLHEMNVNAQCRHCNFFQKGNIQGYRLGILRKWGKNTDLILESQKGKKKIHSWELEALNEVFLKRISQLKKEKGL